ncbi:hypothetical protein ACVW07_000677 [Cellulomonas sp. URHB0016]
MWQRHVPWWLVSAVVTGGVVATGALPADDARALRRSVRCRSWCSSRP